jgi:peptidoglycan glycosyltransferase
MNISTSIRKLTNVFLALFVLLSTGLVYWQVIVAPQVIANSHNSRHCLPDSAPIRGRILDRNGVVLAYSKRVDPNSPNAGILCGYQRIYTEPSLAGLIGYYISPNFGSTGIEHEFDNYLSGQVGLTQLDNTINMTLHRPPVGDDIYLTIDVRIQRIVNHLFDADAPPPDNTNVFATDRGSVIVADPHTGEILAMLSRPGFDPNRIASGDLNYFQQLVNDPEQPLLERPLQGRYVPGSTYKTMTLLAGLDSNTVQLSDQFDMQHALGPVVIGGTSSPVCIAIPPQGCGPVQETIGPIGNNITGYTYHFPVDLEYGYTHSDNIIFAQVGARTGIDTWLNYNKKFYVGQPIPFDLPVAPSSVTPANGQPLTTTQLAENSFGQGIDFITPMQMSVIDNVVANDGTLMRPMLISRIVQPQTVNPNPTSAPAPIPMNPNQTVVQSNSPQSLGQLVSANTAMLVRRAMYGVVRCGSGSLVAVRLGGTPWQIIGKTGTGEVGGGKPAEAWLITQAPFQNPRITIAAMKENGGEGGNVNGPMESDMYSQILPLLNTPLPAPLPPTSPTGNYCYDTGLLQNP